MWTKTLLVLDGALCKKCRSYSSLTYVRNSRIAICEFSNHNYKNHEIIRTRSRSLWKSVGTNFLGQHQYSINNKQVADMGGKKRTRHPKPTCHDLRIVVTELNMPSFARIAKPIRDLINLSLDSKSNLLIRNTVSSSQSIMMSSCLKPLFSHNSTRIVTELTKKYCTKSSNVSKEKSDSKNNVINSRRTHATKNNVEELVENKENCEDFMVKSRTDMAKLFPQPKNTLGNIYSVVATEKNSHELRLSPSFKASGKSWICSYKIKWPEDKTFVASGGTKKQASSNCALDVLKYLLDNKSINEKGTPKLFTKEDIQQITRENIPVLQFQDHQMVKLNEIVDLHVNEVFPMINQPNVESSDDELLEDKKDEVRTFNQKFLGYNRYKCREELYLPVSDFKSQVVQMVEDNRVVIIKGEPGCGKSTRIPQYIMEGWAEEADAMDDPFRIVVTEPRRIAAVSLAERVADERKEEVGSVVGYQVRMKSNFNMRSGRILYCTNGILLQSFKSDPNLSKFTHVIIDEAHERDINTDLLLNMLRRVLDINPKLKVIIMSATIDTGLFQNYFEGSQILHIPGFTYPVKSYFLDNCKLNLEKTLAMCKESKPTVVHEDVVKVLMYVHKNKPEGSILCFLPGWEDIKKVRDSIPVGGDVSVLCLHSRLEDKEQWRIFTKSPPGVRKIILSTNIAESSVTINDVSYVVDTGIHKETNLDVDKGMMSIDNYWISQSSVDQRKGRAGRVKSGECFHLYTKEKMSEFSKFSIPEVLRASLTKVVLDSKAYIPNMSAVEFFSKLPSPPGIESVELAVNELKDLELIDQDEKLTNLGEVIVDFQLEPKLSKAMVNSVIYKCVTPIVDIVTLFSAGSELFASGLDMKETIRSLKASFSKTSDHLAMMRIFEIWDEFRENGNRGKMGNFCNDLRIIPARMHFVRALKDIHSRYLTDGLHCRVLPISDDFSDDDEIVKAVLYSGVGSFLSTKNFDIVNGKLKRNNSLVTRQSHKATVTPDSVNFKTTSLKSQFLVYLNETRSSARRTTLIRETSLIPAATMLLFSNQKILIHLIDKDRHSKSLKSDEQVIVSLPGTKINFIMDRKQATTVLQCKLALSSCYDYYVYQLTKGGEVNQEINTLWDEILTRLSDFLKEFKTD